ncbi:hypothetical protein [Parasitella parasitica]|uniref:Gem-associated protein 5 TPR domain-containing protein n=1 Tax=Parasitella parasitica TaxID=35722 RepID=A0A0B7NGY5_9FUNG|nr:hypothetical protein [Parasitella parasitica]
MPDNHCFQGLLALDKTIQMDLIYPKHRCYPPAPNWYSLYAAAIVEPNFFLYASRNLVVVLGLSDLRYYNSFTVTEDKAEVIAACGNYCYTAGTDKAVRLWDFTLGSMLSIHNEHDKDITVLSVAGQGAIVISADKAGKIVLADTFLKTSKPRETDVSSAITCIAPAQVESRDYIAVGYENGMVFIYEIQRDLSMTIVGQIMEDTDPIQSVDWQPLNQSSNEWPLLAFSTKRKSQIFFWSFPSQSIISSLRLPRPPAQITEGQKSAAWVQVIWQQSHRNMLYFSSYLGSILCADLSNPHKPKINNKKRMDKHSRQVFAMNFFNQGANLVSISMDAQLIKWDVEHGLDVQVIKTQTKYPYCMESLSWDKGQLAIAMGEKEIKYWKFSTADDVVQPQSNPNYYAATIIWKGLQGKVQRIRGHPFVDGVVAYSNEFGHVGMCDSFIKNSAVKFSKHHTMESAPFIDWGPNMCDILQREDMKAPLVSCGGDGTVHVYDMNSIKTPPVRLCDLMEKLNPAWFSKLKSVDSRRHAMKIDEKLLYIAFGHTNGFLEIYSLKTLKLIYTTDYQRHCITSLAWKYFGDKVYLAAGCCNGQIVVYDMADLDLDSKGDAPMLGQHKCLIEFSLHKDSVNDIKWSLHQDKALLASASDDNYIYVWSMDIANPIAEFNEHRSRVFSVEWNHNDFDVLFSGSQDKFIYEWNFYDFVYQEKKNVEPTKYHKERFALQNKRKRKEAALSASASTDGPTPARKKPKAPTNLSQCTLDVARASENSTSRIKREQFCMRLANKLLDGKVANALDTMKSMLSSDQAQDATVDRYLSLWDSDNTRKQQRQNIHELLYGDKNDIRHLIDLEVSAIDDDAQSSYDLGYEVEQDVKNKRDVKLAMDITRCQFTLFDLDTTNSQTSSGLIDWIILALSPMVSKEKWLELMLRQAKKMESINQFNLAAACYIACSHVYDAIEMYKQHDMFREALVIAKLRLPPADPIVKSLFTDWAKFLQKEDQDTLTATCYLLSDTAGSIEIAMDCIARDGKESGLFYAACLAVATEDQTKEQRVDRWLSFQQE